MVRHAVVLGCVAALGAGIAHAGDEDVAAGFVGTWTYAGADAEQQARLDAIDETVAQMFGIARPFARKVMRKNTTNPSCFHIQLDGDQVGIGEEPDALLWSKLDGTPVDIEGYHAGQQVWRAIDGDCLHSRSQQHNGGGTHVFRLSPDGHTMTVQVIIDSERLPLNLTYELTFQRGP